ADPVVGELVAGQQLLEQGARAAFVSGLAVRAARPVEERGAPEVRAARLGPRLPDLGGLGEARRAVLAEAHAQRRRVDVFPRGIAVVDPAVEGQRVLVLARP